MIQDSIHFHIIIVNYKNWVDTCECLSNLFENNYVNFSVSVIDNASPNDSCQQLINWAHNHAALHPGFIFTTYTENDLSRSSHDLTKFSLTFIWASRNGGFATGNNLSLRHILQQKPEKENMYVWLVNPDVTVEPNILSSVSSYIEKEGLKSKKIIWGVHTYDYNNKLLLLHIGGGQIVKPLGIVKFITNPKRVSEMNYVSGGCLIAPLSAFKELGVLPDKYFLYWEETDWCTMAIAAGYLLSSLGIARVYDKVGSSIGRGYLAEYYYTRNALVYARKYYPIWIITILLFNLVRVIKRSLSLKWTNASAILIASFDFIIGRKVNSNP